MRTAIITFNGNFEGLQQTTRLGNVLVLVNRPQEAVFALQLLKVAFDQYFTTVAEYNRAQFELFHALGYPARELAQLRPPGESSRWTRHGPPTCPRWATGRRRQRDERVAVYGHGGSECLLFRRQRGFTHAPASDQEVLSPLERLEAKQLLSAGALVDRSREPRGRGLPRGRDSRQWCRQEREATCGTAETPPRLPRVPHHQPEPVQQHYETSFQPGSGPIPSAGSRSGLQPTLCRCEERNRENLRREQWILCEDSSITTISRS